ncbi:MAG: excinuclease ABC subunit UvrC [Candidatus Omnitrophica bacterium]|nr:excinuclease ABC subunit UvrC [Candidatus Omnitrophota bacterium]
MGIKETIRKFPDSPGVYLMKDAKGRVIYVGKAGSLKKRVSSYFTKSKRKARTVLLVSQIKDIDYIQTNSEAEALIYEASLIKSKRPKFNIELKDDKSYPYLKLTVNEKYPRLFITRRVEDDGAKYYGPYTNVKLLKQALSFIQTIFPFRTCGRLGRRLCINYHIAKCPGPCAGKIYKREYKRMVNELRLFLEGRRHRLVRTLSCHMEAASKSLNFEDALLIRNRIRALSTLVTKRRVPGPMDQVDELKFLLNLKRRPKRIEAFDISNIHGREAVGSMVAFYDGKPDKKNYRKFKIKTVNRIDDYKMMREVVRRRYRRLLEERRSLPDLIIIDGGRGHLSSAVKELKRLRINHIPAIGIAKEFEHIYTPKRPLPIILPKDSSVLQLIKRIRDEAHRFARRYHIALRRKKMFAR